MTITLIDLYNKITGQSWSMFDTDVEADDEFETSVLTSIQKALSKLWCDYPYPFRDRTLILSTVIGKNDYDTPNGNIIKKTINGATVFGIKIGNTFLEYNPNAEVLVDNSGKPTSFYLQGDKIILYPTPDDVYEVKIQYLTYNPACDKFDEEKQTLEKETDYINVPEKYETLFLNTLMPLTMYYAIASDSDSNSSGYYKQYLEAYKILIDFTQGIDISKRIGW